MQTTLSHKEGWSGNFSLGWQLSSCWLGATDQSSAFTSFLPNRTEFLFPGTPYKRMLSSMSIVQDASQNNPRMRSQCIRAIAYLSETYTQRDTRPSPGMDEDSTVIILHATLSVSVRPTTWSVYIDLYALARGLCLVASLFMTVCLKSKTFLHFGHARFGPQAFLRTT